MPVPIAVAAAHSAALLALLLFATGVLVGVLASVAWRALARLRASTPDVALRNPDIWMRALFDANVVPFMFWHETGLISEANDAFLQLVGYTRDELQRGALHLSNLTSPEWRAIDEQLRCDITKTGRFSLVENAYRRRDGSSVPVLLGGASVPGRRDCGVTFAVDISQRTRVEAALADELQTRRAITDNASAAVFLLDRDGRCSFINRAAEEMTGFTLADVGDRFLHDVLHHNREDGTPYPIEDCPIVRAFRERRGLREHEDVFFRKNGEPFPVVCNVSPVDVRLGASVIDIRDVTLQKQAERDRETLLGSERAARAEAERASRLKDDFVATMSHELRTPLNAILGWAQLLRSAPQDAQKQARGIEVIERNARVQIQLIGDLLDVSRIARGKMHLEHAAVDLAATVLTALEELHGAAAAKGVALTTALAAPGAPVIGDAFRLMQVVSNLVSNAIKFTPAGGRVEVVLERRGACAELSVSDTGQGIAPDFLPCLFERFRQADASAARQHGGLGLGLSIVKSLVELHGGRVRAESEGLGKGARFVVSLPLQRAPGALAPGPIDGAASYTLPRLEGVRVLVVDDEPDAREIAQRVLEDCDAAVITASSAAEALSALRATQPDVVVSDISW
jgi:PAS domain S-box-containing protein